MIQILFFKKLENITSKHMLFQKTIEKRVLLLSNQKSNNK